MRLLRPVCACLLLETAVLAWPAPAPGRDAWFGRQWSGPITGDVSLLQRFLVANPNFREITFYSRPSDREVSGAVHLKLAQVIDTGTIVVDERQVPASEVVATGRYKYRFNPIPARTTRYYEFTISAPDVPMDRAIAVDVIRGPYDDNRRSVLTFANRRRWASLRFTTEVDHPAVLTRAIRTLRHGALGAATLPIVTMVWVSMHFLTFRAISLLAAYLRATPADTLPPGPR